MTAANRKQPFGRKHVPSSAPGAGPKDASGKLDAHRGVNDGPTTVGVNPDASARKLANGGDTLTSGTPVAYSGPLVFPPNGGNC